MCALNSMAKFARCLYRISADCDSHRIYRIVFIFYSILGNLAQLFLKHLPPFVALVRFFTDIFYQACDVYYIFVLSALQNVF